MIGLLQPEDFEDLPNGSGPKWVRIESIARSKLAIALNNTDDPGTQKRLKLQYMRMVVAAAEELGIQGISFPGGNDPATQLEVFMIATEAAVAKVFLSFPVEELALGFKPRDTAKSRIVELVEQIRSEIPKLKLTKREEERLSKALHSFVEELEFPRSRFSVGSGHLMIALTVLNLGVATLAQGPQAIDAIQEIQTIWGDEFERAEVRKLGIDYVKPFGLLPAPQKQIEGPQKGG